MRKEKQKDEIWCWMYIKRKILLENAFFQLKLKIFWKKYEKFWNRKNCKIVNVKQHAKSARTRVFFLYKTILFFFLKDTFSIVSWWILRRCNAAPCNILFLKKVKLWLHDLHSVIVWCHTITFALWLQLTLQNDLFYCRSISANLFHDILQ